MTLAWWRKSWSTTMTKFRRVRHSIIRSFGTSHIRQLYLIRMCITSASAQSCFFLPCDCASCGLCSREADQWQSFSSSLGFMWNFYPPNVSKWVCLKIVYPYTQWLMIIIYNWGYTPCSDIPKCSFVRYVPIFCGIATSRLAKVACLAARLEEILELSLTIFYVRGHGSWVKTSTWVRILGSIRAIDWGLLIINIAIADNWHLIVCPGV